MKWVEFYPGADVSWGARRYVSLVKDGEWMGHVWDVDLMCVEEEEAVRRAWKRFRLPVACSWTEGEE